MRAVKGNKEYTIDESQQRHYQAAGYDILDDGGNIAAYGRGKTVPYEKYLEKAKELEAVKRELAGLKTGKEPSEKKDGA